MRIAERSGLRSSGYRESSEIRKIMPEAFGPGIKTCALIHPRPNCPSVSASDVPGLANDQRCERPCPQRGHLEARPELESLSCTVVLASEVPGFGIDRRSGTSCLNPSRQSLPGPAMGESSFEMAADEMRGRMAVKHGG
jgi:hypothetical protein